MCCSPSCRSPVAACCRSSSCWAYRAAAHGDGAASCSVARGVPDRGRLQPQHVRRRDARPAGRRPGLIIAEPERDRPHTATGSVGPADRAQDSGGDPDELVHMDWSLRVAWQRCRLHRALASALVAKHRRLARGCLLAPASSVMCRAQQALCEASHKRLLCEVRDYAKRLWGTGCSAGFMRP